MTDNPAPKTAPMQGAGAYNRSSALQAANLTSALPLLERAARSVPIGGDAPLVLVDYGASQGLNSMQPMGAALDILRARAGPQRPLEVVHTDLPANDFTALFTILADDERSYLSGRQEVFPSAIGRSYFEPMLPPGRVVLGWSSNALHWLSRNPVHAPDHGWAVFSQDAAVRAAVDRQLDEDWQAFLQARASELCRGGQLVCQFMGRGPDHHGFEWMADAFWASLSSMGADGLLSDDELLRMTCPSAGRSVEQIEAPSNGGAYHGLRLDHVSVVEGPDPFWETYRQSGDADQLGRSWAKAMLAANGPNFTAALNPNRDVNVFLHTLGERLSARVAADPRRSQTYLLLVVLKKLFEDSYS